MPVAVLLAISLCAFAQNTAHPASQSALEPYHIKNDVLGEPMETYRQNNPECTDKNPVTGESNFRHLDGSTKWSGSCFTIKRVVVTTYANREMEGKSAKFWEDRFVRLTYMVKPSDYEFLRDNLIEKFGEPTKKLTQRLSGGQVTTETLLWDNGVSTIRFTKYSDSSGDVLTFSLTKFDKQMEAIQKKSAKKDM